jgi:hypothetical protein
MTTVNVLFMISRGNFQDSFLSEARNLPKTPHDKQLLGRSVRDVNYTV